MHPDVPPGRNFDDKTAEVRKCEFVGEIALTVADLQELARIVRQELNSHVPARGADERLILAAVNCAYFYMDAEGFWKPFCKMLGEECNQAVMSHIGNRIERALLRLGHLDEPGYGAFRYVTPIRMQAGLTRYDIPIFATLLEAAHHDFGWGALKTLPHPELIAFLDRTHPAETRFIAFLKDSRSGSRLLRDVVRHLVLWRHGLIDESGLNSLRGYRPGFWSELLTQLGKETHTARAGKSAVASPIFIFDENRRECGLLFSRELVNRNAFKFDGDTVRESFNPLRSVEDFCEEYEVETNEGTTLRIAAWKPTEETPFALFKQGGEYLPRSLAIYPGAYLLVAFQRSTPPESLSCISDFEFCATPGLRFWHVEVDANTDLAALGYARSGSQTPVRLAWVEGAATLDGVSDAGDVFLGHLPALSVAPTDLLIENRAALCWSTGGESGRVQVTGNSEEGVVELPLSGPCRGEVWIEPLGRERAENGLATVRLSFCVLPKCMIAWPVDLYAEEDEPIFEFRAFAPGIECEFLDCKRVAKAEDSWMVSSGANWIEGQVEADEVAVRVVKRIHRARAENVDGGELWLERSALECDDSVRIRGLPGALVHLELEGSEKRINVPLHQEFNQHGVASVRCWDFHDRLSGVSAPIYRICVHGRNGPVPTHGRIADLAEIEKWLFDDMRQSEADWLALLGDEGVAVLRSLAQSLIDPQRADSPDSFQNHLPEFFTRWARSIFACACIFSANRPPAGLWRPALDAVPSDWRKTLDWVVSTEVALAEGGDLGRASDEFTELTWQPPRAAWRSFLAGLHASVRAEHDLIPLVDDWRDEIERRVVDGMPVEWSSALACMAGGDHLSTAFMQNLRGETYQEDHVRYQAALLRAYTALSAIQASSPPLVLCLARLLKELLLLNFGVTDELTEPLPAHCHRLLRPLLFPLLKNRGRAFQGDDCDVTSALQPDLLPLPEGDRERLRAMLLIHTTRISLNEPRS